MLFGAVKRFWHRCKMRKYDVLVDLALESIRKSRIVQSHEPDESEIETIIGCFDRDIIYILLKFESADQRTPAVISGLLGQVCGALWCTQNCFHGFRLFRLREGLVTWRAKLREEKKFELLDEMREVLSAAGFKVADKSVQRPIENKEQ